MSEARSFILPQNIAGGPLRRRGRRRNQLDFPGSGRPRALQREGLCLRLPGRSADQEGVVEAEDPDRQTPRWMGKVIYVVSPPVLGLLLAFGIGKLVQDESLVVSRPLPPSAKAEALQLPDGYVDPLDRMTARARPRSRLGLCTARFESTPPGALVTVNGQELGTTPVPATSLPCGPVSVTMTREQYLPFSRKLEVYPGERADVVGVLQRARADTETATPDQVAALPR